MTLCLLFLLPLATSGSTICTGQPIKINISSSNPLVSINQANFALNQTCRFEISIQANRILELFIKGEAKKASSNTLGLSTLDNYNQSMQLGASNTYIFPPSRLFLSMTVPAKKTQAKKLRIQLSLKDVSSNSVQQRTIPAGIGALIVPTKEFNASTSYEYKRTEPFTVFYSSENPKPNNGLALGYKGIVGNQSVMGLGHQLSSVRNFTDVQFFNVSKGKSDGFLVFMNASDAAGFHSPQFLRFAKKSRKLSLDAGSGRTFATIIAPSDSGTCANYTLDQFVFSDNLQLIVVNGFAILPTKVFGYYNSTSLQDGDTIPLTGTKTLVLMNGTLSARMTAGKGLSKGHGKKVHG